MTEGTAEETAAEKTGLPHRPRVLVFFDYACPFCYLDWPRFKRLRAEHDVDLYLVPYELRPGLPASGVPIAQAGRHSERVEEYMIRMAKESGIPLAFPSFMPNTHYALALAEFARELGPEAHEAVHEAIFEAYSGHGRDIGDVDTLLAIAEEHALDPVEVAAAFGDGRYDERLHGFLHLAVGMGVSATPSALICNVLFIGSRPYKVLEAALEECLVTPAAIEARAQAEELASREAE